MLQKLLTVFPPSTFDRSKGLIVFWSGLVGFYGGSLHTDTDFSKT